jgi:predicted glycosyltransferase
MTVEKPKKIWIDLDNSPHVPFFNPIINELKQRAYFVTLTARDCFQVCGLADLYGLQYSKIGRHYGKIKVLKVIGTIIRSIQLLPVVLRERPALALSHGSRSQLMTAKMLRIPVVVVFDYEFTQDLGPIVPDWTMGPELVSNSISNSDKKRFFKYPGIKEDVYVSSFEPDHDVLNELGLSDTDLIVTIRPPATEAHYHNTESETLFITVVEFLAQKPDVRIVILPRNEKKQTAWVKNMWSELCKKGKIIIPNNVMGSI